MWKEGKLRPPREGEFNGAIKLAFAFPQGCHEVPAAGITAVGSSKATNASDRGNATVPIKLEKEKDSNLLKLMFLLLRLGEDQASRV